MENPPPAPFGESPETPAALVGVESVWRFVFMLVFLPVGRARFQKLIALFAVAAEFGFSFSAKLKADRGFHFFTSTRADSRNF
jgi:hypothetical protein